MVLRGDDVLDDDRIDSFNQRNGRTSATDDVHFEESHDVHTHKITRRHSTPSVGPPRHSVNSLTNNLVRRHSLTSCAMDHHSLELSNDDPISTSSRHDSTPSLTSSLYSVDGSYDDVSSDSIVSVNDFANYHHNIEYCQRSCPSSNLQFYPVHFKKKSVCMTYLLTLFLGIVGGHHFYLGRPKFGTLYVFTAGLLGMGYVVDLIRVPWLVENAYLETLHPELRRKKYMMDAYLLWLPPFGLLGFHHFYLGNTFTGIIYLITAGCFVIGWFLDIVLIPLIWVKRANCEHFIASANQEIETVEGPEILPSEDISLVTSPDVFFITDGVAFSQPVMLTPPPYTELDVREGSYNPPTYAEVLAMDAGMSDV